MKRITAALLLGCVALGCVGCGEVRNEQLTLEQTTAQNVAREQTVTAEPPTFATEPTTQETTQAQIRHDYSTVPFNAAAVTGKADSFAGTFTGFAPLTPVRFSVNDPQNTRGLSTAAINHSFGVAKDGVPHTISVESQKYFDAKNFNAVTYDNKSTDKVLYLTFDCGYENGYTSKVLDTLKEKKVPAAFFCTLEHIKSEPELIARMIKEGHIVGNHSAKHPNFSKIDRTRMAKEVEECDNYLREHFGYTSPYFRFPEGAYSDSALDLIGSLGYKTVFWSAAYADWDTSKQKGADYAYDKVTSRLHPGAIILLHSVSSDNAQALGRILDYAVSQGYTFKSLTQLP